MAKKKIRYYDIKNVLLTGAQYIMLLGQRANGKSYKELIVFVEDRAGHDFRYAIDATKLENELGWKADETFDTGIVKTVEWYLNNRFNG